MRTPEERAAVAAALGVSDDRVTDWLWTLHKIVVDVERTDRHMEFYTVEANMATMADILAVHAWIDPLTGFCQGMCDILSPFILMFTDAADAFWCFECLFSRIRHNFLEEGPVGIMRQLAALADVLGAVDSELMDHLAELGADDFMFAFRMLLVLFRRELPLADVLVMWEMMWAADFDPQMAAALLHCPPEGLNLRSDASLWAAGTLLYADSSSNPAAASAAFANGSGSSSMAPSGDGSLASGGSALFGSGGVSGPQQQLSLSSSSSLLSSRQWGQERSGDEDLTVFCVAAILKTNRKRILQIEGSDQAIKMFADVELALDVATCIQLALKLRTKYRRKKVQQQGGKSSKWK